MSEEKFDLEAPKWMIELEKRLNKKTKKLGHEYGAGATCLKCEDNCPGFELHYWRKRCLNCKCKKEDHDISEEEEDLRVDILLSKEGSSEHFMSIKGVLDLKFTTLQNESSMKNHSSIGQDYTQPVLFDWIPPDTSKELAAEYMLQLPSNKIPVEGSPGAKYRKLQLEKQIPLYDISPDICHKLSKEEQKGFHKYLENIRENVVGQGKIQRICQKQFIEESVPYTSLPQPHCSGSLIPLPGKEKVQDNCDSLSKLKNMNNLIISPYHSPVSKFVKPPKSSSPAYLPSVFLGPSPFKTNHLKEGGDGDTDNSFIDRSSITERSFEYPSYPSRNQSFQTVTPSPTEKANSSSDSSILGNLGALSKMSGETTSEYCTPTNSTTSESLDRSGYYTPTDGEESNSTLTNDITTSPTTPLDGITTAKRKDSPFPRSLYQESGNDGIDLSQQRLNRPQKNKFTPRYLKFDEYEECEDDQNANPPSSDNSTMIIEKEMNCFHCKKKIAFGAVAVVADRAGSEVVWHPQCFVCDECQELLVDLVYFFYKGHIYCGRHYADKLEMLRCFACDELIFVKEYTVAEGKSYHVGHFCCIKCDTELGGKKYVLFEEQPMCLECYETSYCKACASCQQTIKPNEQGLKLHDLDWHATPECFKCTNCHKSLVNSQFTLNKNKPFCSKACVSMFNSSTSSKAPQ